MKRPGRSGTGEGTMSRAFLRRGSGLGKYHGSSWGPAGSALLTERFLDGGNWQEQRPGLVPNRAESVMFIKPTSLIVLCIHQDGEGCVVGPHCGISCGHQPRCAKAAAVDSLIHG